MKKHYDIVIIGCGLVGGSLALTLPPSLSIAVIDAESPMQQQPGYLALNIHSCHILKNFGVWENIANHKTPGAVTPIKQINCSELNQSTEQLILSAEDIGSPALGYVTSTIAIRETLLAHIQSQKNITLYCPELAEDIQWPDEGIQEVCVKLSQQNKFISAKLVIMADGGRSSLRHKMGFQVLENEASINAEHHIVISRLKTRKPHEGLAFERFTTQGPIALLPVNQDEYILVWTMNHEKLPQFLGQNETTLITALQKAYDHLEIKEWQEIGSRKSYPIICSHVKNPIKTRLVLMGNAAHTVHPVGAQGFNLSLKDAFTLSTLIREAVATQQDIGSERLLKQYLAHRQEDTNFVLYFTQFLLNVFSNNTAVFSKIRAMGMRLMNQSSWMKQMILKQTTGKMAVLPPLPSLPPPRGKEQLRGFPPQGRKEQNSGKNHHHYDIIILGNRLIGSTLACTLDPRYRIAILDKAPTPILPILDSQHFELRINAYNRASEALLKVANVWEKLPTNRCFAFDKIYATHEQNQSSLAFDSKTIHEPHIGHFIENDLVTYYLHQQIKTLPNVDFFDNASVINIQPLKESIQIITDDRSIFSAKLLAACDGANSTARNLLGIDVSRHPYYQRCIVGNIFFDGDLDKTAWQCFLKTGPLGLLPLSKGVCSLAWSCDNAEAQRLLALSNEVFIMELEKATRGRLGKILKISPRQSFPLAAQHAEHYIAERTLLLGDAAHTIHPLGGLGANLGFQDIMAAIALLNDTKISSRDIGRRYLLEKYETSRRRHNALVMSTMTAFNALFHKNHPTLNPLGRLSLNLANTITPLKNALFRQAMWMGTNRCKS